MYIILLHALKKIEASSSHSALSLTVDGLSVAEVNLMPVKTQGSFYGKQQTC